MAGIGEEILISKSAAATQRIGAKLAKKLAAGTVVALFGELGSGKTTFIRGVCHGLHVSDEVSSPTFTLIHEYFGIMPVYHFDFYRIVHSDEAWELGLDEYFSGDGVCLIEWADKVIDLLPGARVEVHLKNFFKEGLENSREIRVIWR